MTNGQYEDIMAGYAARRSDRERMLSSRRAKVLEKIPAYAALEEEAARVREAYLKALLSGGSASAAPFSPEETAAKKKALLMQHGFPEDYLDIPFTCPLCRDTGFVNGEKCLCFKKAETALLYDQSQLYDLIRKNRFSLLSSEYYRGNDLVRFEKALQIAHTFIDEFGRDPGNLFFYGPSGTGKTCLSVCIAAELLEKGVPVLYFSAVQLFDRLAALSFRRDPEADDDRALSDLLRNLNECDLLVIDDLGTELMNSFIGTRLFTLVNERILRKKPTILSTNLSLQDLQARYSDRVFSRIASAYILCNITGPDIRLQKKMKRRKADFGGDHGLTQA